MQLRFNAFACFCVLFVGTYSLFSKLVVNALAAYLLFFTISKFSKKVITPMLNINILLFLFATIILFSAFWNHIFTLFPYRPDIVNPLSAIRAASVIVNVPFILQYYSSKHKTLTFLNKFLHVLFVFMVVVDIYAIFNRPSTGEGDEALKVFVIGSKFTVIYMHFVGLVLFWYKCRLKRIKHQTIYLGFLLFLTFFFSYYLFCTTALLGSIVLLFLYIFEKRIQNIVVNVKIQLLGMSLATLFVVFVTFAVSNEKIAYIIQDVLHEDLTLTGRTLIWAEIFDIISYSPWLGFGYGNSHSVVSYFVVGNSQNGVLECVINYGIIGFFFLLLIFILSTNRSKKNMTLIYPFYSLISVFVIMSSVEITFGNLFVFVVMLSAICSTEASMYRRLNNKCSIKKINIQKIKNHA